MGILSAFRAYALVALYLPVICCFYGYVGICSSVVVSCLILAFRGLLGRCAFYWLVWLLVCGWCRVS